jgi:TetR/AcrR family transcriptional regulator, transcriptional repressor for nem operon
VRLFSRTYADDGRLCVCGMLGAEADALPATVADAVEAFFRLNLTWLAAAFRDAQSAQQVRADLRAGALAEALLAALEGAMVVGRGARSGGGPASVGKTFLASIGF